MAYPKVMLGDYIVNNYGRDFLNKIWSDKNDISSFCVGYGSHKKMWFNCPNGIHEPELRAVSNARIRGFKCRQCSIKEQHLKQLDNLVGQKFNKWTVIEKDEEQSKRIGVTYWFCDCDCGTKHISVPACNLKAGVSKSCGCLRKEYSGEKHWNWQGGKTKDITKERNSYKYGLWRKSIFKRDNYTCQCCGKKGGKLNAHHIENFADNEDLRFDINNGITLCEECHSWKFPNSFHTLYGTRNNNRKQLEEFITWKRNELQKEVI